MTALFHWWCYGRHFPYAGRVPGRDPKGAIARCARTNPGQTARPQRHYLGADARTRPDSPEQRREVGAKLNALRDEVAGASRTVSGLGRAALDQRLAVERADVTLPVRAGATGRIHPISQTIDEIVAIFGEMGFAVAEGPAYRGGFLQLHRAEHPAGAPGAAGERHVLPARAADGRRLVLRTHTSPVQIRTMLAQKPPIRIIVPGRTFRCDHDATHSPMFHQVEGLVIDRTTHMGHLKGCLIEFCRAFFGVDDLPVRFRPSYFPFTEPSAEVDIGCSRAGRRAADRRRRRLAGDPRQRHGASAGAGELRHRPGRYQGFAFGMGIERVAMLKYGIPDLRTFFESDLRWLRHYGFVPLDIPSLVRGPLPGGSRHEVLAVLAERPSRDRGSAAEIAERLIMLGHDVEGIDDRAAALARLCRRPSRFGEPHPNADRLRVCVVDAGEAGAGRVRRAQRPHRHEGRVRPGRGTSSRRPAILTESAIRGVASRGMLMSAEELGLGEDHDGIIELPEDAPVGARYAELLGLDDPVIDLKVTPNRADCLGVRGIARDLAAAGVGG